MVECHCVLPQYRKAQDPVYHKFVVFSVLENDTVIPKYVQCNNCGVVHKVYDLCKSEIMPGKDELRTVTKIEDIRLSLPNDLVELLTSYKCDVSTWEQVRFVIFEEQWDTQVVLTRDMIDGETQGKLLTIKGSNKFAVENYIARNEI